MKASKLLVIFFAVKIFFDFFSPSRPLNFLVTTALAILILLLPSRELRKSLRLTGKMLLGISTYLIACVYWLAISREVESFLRYSSLVPIFLATRMLVQGCNFAELGQAARKILSWQVGIFILFFIISFVVAAPLTRIFYNFEHANILGSYCLCSVAFVFIAANFRRDGRFSRYAPFLMCAASTSTGATLLSAIPIVRIKRSGFRQVFFYLVLGILAVCLLGFVLQQVDPSLFEKIFGPFQLILDGRLQDVVSLARTDSPIQELDDKYQSSLTWRFYAYVVYYDYISAMTLWEFLFGLGFDGYTQVWGGMMPHNDFILLLVDHGLIVFLFVIFFLSRSVISFAKKKPSWLILPVILFFRLLLENNISSFYLVSTGIMCVTFVHCVFSQEARAAKKVGVRGPLKPSDLGYSR